MELQIDSKLREGLLVVTAIGSVRLDAVLRLLKEVCDAAVENQVGKILVDSLAVDGDLASFERYRLGTELAEYLTQCPVELKMAFVGVPPAVNGFGVRIARNRGVAVKVFSV